MTSEAQVGWEVLVTLRGHAVATDKVVVGDLTQVRMFIVAPDIQRAEATAIDYLRREPARHAPEGITVTESRVDRVSRILDQVAVWRGITH